jgi:hypothetical protein
MDSKMATCKTVTTCIAFKILNRIAPHFNFSPFHSPYYYIDVRNLSMIGQSICLIRVQCASYKEERMSCVMGRRKNKDGEGEGWRRRMMRMGVDLPRGRYRRDGNINDTEITLIYFDGGFINHGDIEGQTINVV